MKILSKVFAILAFAFLAVQVNAQSAGINPYPYEDPELIAPEFNQILENLTPELSWSSVANGDYFIVEMSHYEGTALVLDFEQHISAKTYSPQISLQVAEGILEHNRFYVWRVKACNYYGEGPWSEYSQFLTNYDINVGTDNSVPRKLSTGSDNAGKYKLNKNYPNPFNPATKISFEIPSASFVKLSVFNILGKEVASLVNGYMNPGAHTVDFNGSALSSGIYFCRMEVNGLVFVSRMNLIK